MKLGTLGSLKQYDSSLVIIQGDENLPVLGITDHFQLSEGHKYYLVFIKNNKFLTEWLENNKLIKNTGLIFERNYFEKLNPETALNVQSRALFIGTVADVNLAMTYFSKPFYEEKIKKINDIVDGRQMGTAEIDPSAFIAQGVFIGQNACIKSGVKIHSGVVLMSGVEISENTEIYPNTVIYRDVKIGKNVRIHSNVTIGSDGFGYHFKDGQHLKIWHMGGVIIGDNVEIGANTCVDGGTFSPTIIGAGSKIDNQVQIGHNSHLGIGVIMCGQSGLAGSCTIGDFVVMGGRAAIAPGVSIGAAAQIAGSAGVTSSVGAGEVVGGFPARDIKEWMRGVAFLRKLSSKPNN